MAEFIAFALFVTVLVVALSLLPEAAGARQVLRRGARSP